VISASDFHTYYQLEECARRVWLEANRPGLKADPSEFDQVLFRKGREHEEAHLATFPGYVRPAYPVGDLAAGAAATARLLRQSEPVIYQGVLMSPDGGTAGIPDFLIREGDAYVIRDAKLALNLDRHPEIPAQIGLYSRLLRDAAGLPVARCEVLLGNGDLLPVPPVDVTGLVSRLGGIKSAPEEPDEAVGWSKCNTCGFCDHCWNDAVKAHDPAVVPGIEQGLRNALVGAGIARYEGMQKMGVRGLAGLRFQQKTRERQVGEKTAEKVLRQVRVLVSGKMEVLVPPDEPPVGLVAYFDIESNPWDVGMETRVYLWGLLLDRSNGSPPEYWGTVARAGAEGDAAAWQAFLTRCGHLIEEFGDVPYVHYSHYEKTWITQYIQRWGDHDGVGAKVLSLLWDMEKRAIRGRLCLPVHSYGLKHVEKCAGFKRSQGEYGALWSVGRYGALLEAADDAARTAIENELLTYNREDCVAMRHVLRWASGFR